MVSTTQSRCDSCTPKGCAKSAQGNALGTQARIKHQALKGRANAKASAPFQGMSFPSLLNPQSVVLG